MNAETFCAHFATFAEAPNGVGTLREFILNLAVQGQLVPDDVSDGLNESETYVEDFLTVQNGYAFKSEWFTSDGVRLVRNVNVGHDELRWNDLACVSKVRSQEFARFELREGDIVISLDRPLISTGLKVARLTKADLPALLLQRVGRPQFKDDRVIPEYFFLWLNSPAFTRSIDPGKSNGVPHISAKEIHRIRFAPPSPKTQKRIVEKVDQLLALCDELEAKQADRTEARKRAVAAMLDRLVAPSSAEEFPAHVNRVRNHFDRLFDTPTTIPQLRQAILQLAVQGQLIPQDPNDEPVESLLQRAGLECVDARDEVETDDETPDSQNESNTVRVDMPKSWLVVKFADLIAYGPRNGISPKPVQHATKTKSLTLSATTSGTFDGRHVKYLTEEFPADSFLWLKDGDILIQRSNSEHYVGVAAIYRGQSNDFVYPDLMMKVRVVSCIDVDFAHLILTSPASRTYFRTKATGTSGSMRKINKTTVKLLPFPLPPLAEQKRIVSRVSELMSLCDALEAKLTQAESASTQLLSAAVHKMLRVER